MRMGNSKSKVFLKENLGVRTRETRIFWSVFSSYTLFFRNRYY